MGTRYPGKGKKRKGNPERGDFQVSTRGKFQSIYVLEKKPPWELLIFCGYEVAVNRKFFPAR